MDKERFKQRYSQFVKALDGLHRALGQPTSEFMRDSVIKRFEFTYEMAWKTMKLWLEEKDIDVRNPKDTLRAALEQDLIRDGNVWTEMQQKRNLTTHTYDEATSIAVEKFIREQAVVTFDKLKTSLEGLA